MLDQDTDVAASLFLGFVLPVLNNLFTFKCCEEAKSCDRHQNQYSAADRKDGFPSKEGCEQTCRR